MSDISTAPHVLHVGAASATLPFYMQHCRETRLDISPDFSPDIVADMADLPPGIGPFDAIYGSHCLEHLPFHKHQQCLSGWLQVLRPSGTVVIFVPDLEDVLPTDEAVYISDAGPITGRDMFYGWGPAVAAGCTYMQHLSGFVQASLHKALEAAGFVDVKVIRLHPDNIAAPRNLFATGRRP